MFHPGREAEALATFKSWELLVVHSEILDFLKVFSHAQLEDVWYVFATCLNFSSAMLEENFEHQVSKSVASHIVCKLDWSWKVPTTFQIAKYNLERYVDFLEWIQSVDDWTKLKFCDESHIVPH
jgi:hypothetical protein